MENKKLYDRQKNNMNNFTIINNEVNILDNYVNIDLIDKMNLLTVIIKISSSHKLKIIRHNFINNNNEDNNLNEGLNVFKRELKKRKQSIIRSSSSSSFENSNSNRNKVKIIDKMLNVKREFSRIENN